MRTPYEMKSLDPPLETMYFDDNVFTTKQLVFLTTTTKKYGIEVATIIFFYIGVIFYIKLKVSRKGVKSSLKVNESISGHRSILILLKNIRNRAPIKFLEGLL